jgi:uncharacterized protein YuzE
MNMLPTRITYDPDGDILYVTFGQPTAATGYQLSDQLLLRVSPQSQTAAGVTIFNYSIHARTAHELPLPGLDEIDEDKPTILQILHSPPVTHFLHVAEGPTGFTATLLRPSLQEAVAG